MYLFSHRLTQMNADMFKYKDITDIILRSFYEAYNERSSINQLLEGNKY